jgi:DNA polymerase I-like protein with 3'-5' exonuclease and polymerase domains
MRRYFDYIGKLVEMPGAKITQLRSGRIRGDVGYTDGCNTLFQGLGADAAKSALFDVCRACYADPRSPLWDCRPVNFVHDEIIAEAPEHRAAEAAEELSRIMVATARRWLPDVRITAEPVLARRWSKNAESVRDASGRLIPWDC